MDRSLIQKALEGVPQTEEDRLLVLKWAISLVKGEENADSEGEENLLQSNPGLVSEVRSGITVQDGPNDDREPTASPGGLTDKGSTASPGGPIKESIVEHTFSKNARAKSAHTDTQQEEDSPPLGELPSKKRKITDDQSGSERYHVMDFDPSSLVDAKEGTCKVPQMMAKY